jgi:CRISPR-associated protein Csm2
MSYQKQGNGYGNKPSYQDQPTLETSDISFKEIKAELFNSVAQRTAQTLASSAREVNKSTQIRRFYDELLMWEMKTSQNESKFNEYLPFILMLNAKVAYAEGRKHVDTNFTRFMNHCLGQVKDAASLRTFKLFFEAMLGFYKLEKKD